MICDVGGYVMYRNKVATAGPAGKAAGALVAGRQAPQ